jgi:hypothetical protein
MEIAIKQGSFSMANMRISRLALSMTAAWEPWSKDESVTGSVTGQTITYRAGNLSDKGKVSQIRF